MIIGISNLEPCGSKYIHTYICVCVCACVYVDVCMWMCEVVFTNGQSAPQYFNTHMIKLNAYDNMEIYC